MNTIHSTFESRERTLLPAVVWFVPAIMLLAAIADLPYEFYTPLRVVVCGATLLLVFHEYELRGKPSGWMAVLAGMAVLFNPLFPVGLSRDDWLLIDAGFAIALVIHYLTCKRLATKRDTDQTQPAGEHPTVRAWAAWLDRKDVLILDTEAHGSRENGTAEVLEVAVIDTTGAELIREYVARWGTRRRGDTKFSRPGSRRWPDVHIKLAAILANSSVVIAYNADHDRQVLEQMGHLYGLTLPPVRWQCAMLDYAEIREESRGNGNPKWHSLDNAGLHEGILTEPRPRPHGALTDTQILREVMRAVATNKARPERLRYKIPPVSELGFDNDIPF